MCCLSHWLNDYRFPLPQTLSCLKPDWFQFDPAPSPHTSLSCCRMLWVLISPHHLVGFLMQKRKRDTLEVGKKRWRSVAVVVVVAYCTEIQGTHRTHSKQLLLPNVPFTYVPPKFVSLWCVYYLLAPGMWTTRCQTLRLASLAEYVKYSLNYLNLTNFFNHS